MKHGTQDKRWSFKNEKCVDCQLINLQFEILFVIFHGYLSDIFKVKKIKGVLKNSEKLKKKHVSKVLKTVQDSAKLMQSYTTDLVCLHS